MRRLLLLLLLVLGIAVVTGAMVRDPLRASATPVPGSSPDLKPKVWDFPGHNLW